MAYYLPADVGVEPIDAFEISFPDGTDLIDMTSTYDKQYKIRYKAIKTHVKIDVKELLRRAVIVKRNQVVGAMFLSLTEIMINKLSAQYFQTNNGRSVNPNLEIGKVFTFNMNGAYKEGGIFNHVAIYCTYYPKNCIVFKMCSGTAPSPTYDEKYIENITADGVNYDFEESGLGNTKKLYLPEDISFIEYDEYVPIPTMSTLATYPLIKDIPKDKLSDRDSIRKNVKYTYFYFSNELYNSAVSYVMLWSNNEYSTIQSEYYSYWYTNDTGFGAKYLRKQTEYTPSGFPLADLKDSTGRSDCKVIKRGKGDEEDFIKRNFEYTCIHGNGGNNKRHILYFTCNIPFLNWVFENYPITYNKYSKDYRLSINTFLNQESPYRYAAPNIGESGIIGYRYFDGVDGWLTADEKKMLSEINSTQKICPQKLKKYDPAVDFKYANKAYYSTGGEFDFGSGAKQIPLSTLKEVNVASILGLMRGSFGNTWR